MDINSCNKQTWITQSNNKITTQMKQNIKLEQKNSQPDLIDQQLLATSTLRDLTQEEDHSFNSTKPNVTYRQRYNHNSHINSWSAQYASLQPKETNKHKPVIQKIQKISLQRKNKPKQYQHTSTTLLQLSQSIEIFAEMAKTKKGCKQKTRNRIATFNSFNERNKILLKRLKKERTHITNPLLPTGSFEQSIKITQLNKNKNRQSSAIKKIKCEMIQKIQLKDEQSKANLQSMNTSKIRFSLQPKMQNMRLSRYVTFQGEKQAEYPKQHFRKKMTRTLYSTVRQPKQEVKYSKVYTEDREKRERGLACSQQFKILINLLKKERGCQDK